MALQSKFKFNEKLRNCEIKDIDHIGQFTFPVADRQGEHVRLIHEALNAFLNGKERFDTITGPEFDNRTFGARTAQVVREFKTDKRLLNFQNQIDEIVGSGRTALVDGVSNVARGEAVADTRDLVHLSAELTDQVGAGHTAARHDDRVVGGNIL